MNTRTEAAIEAMAKALYEDEMTEQSLSWDALPEGEQLLWMRQARIALKVAKDAGVAFKINTDQETDYAPYEEIEL